MQKSKPFSVRLSTIIKSCGNPQIVVDKQKLPENPNQTITVKSSDFDGADFGEIGIGNHNVLHYLTFEKPIPQKFLQRTEVVGINNF